MAAEVYSAANSQRQARQVWNECHDIIRSSPELDALLNPIKSTSRITFETTRSFYEAISSSPKNCEGLNSSGLVIDEVHRFDTSRSEDFFNALRWSGKARRNPLFITISTAGIFNPTATSWRQYKIASDIIKGINTQTDILPIIYELEKEEDWHTSNPKCEEVWKRANPSLGVTMDIDDFRHDVEAAEQSPSSLSAFLRYSFNLWQSSSSAWITDDRLMTCNGSTELSLKQIESFEWFGGLDLASSIDVNGLCLIGKDNDNQKIYVKPFYWVSEKQASLRQRRDQVNYEMWAKNGYMRTTPGDTTDWNIVRRDVSEICKKYRVQKLAIDRWSAHSTAQQLESDGLPVCFYGQGFKDMSPAVKEIERMIYAQELVWDCPVFRWMMSNVEIVPDDSGNVKISRKRSREKVDICISLCQAVGVSMTATKQSIYEKKDIFIV